MEQPLSESAWRRGWGDTKKVWTSWQFFVLDAVVAVVIAGIFQWYWGLAVVGFGMLCVWLRATASAPIKQRDEARALLLAKPKIEPLARRAELISAIHQVKETANEVIIASTTLRILSENGKEPPQRFVTEFSNAFNKYQEQRSNLEREQLIAREAFYCPINSFVAKISSYIQNPIPLIGQPTGVRALNPENTSRLIDARDEAIKEIDEINQSILDKEGSQK